MRVGSISQQEIRDSVVFGGVCPKCGQAVNLPMIRSVLTGTIIFIPFIKKTARYYTICPHCGINYNFSKQSYNSIINSQNAVELLHAECSATLEKTRNKMEMFTERSPKNKFIAALLALFFGIVGAQNWYMRHKKRGLVSISFIALSIIFFILALLAPTIELFFFFAVCPIAANIYWGLFDFFRILSGYAKDSNGLYIMTKRQYETKMRKRSELY